MPSVPGGPSPVDLKLIADLKLLDEPHRQIVREVVRILIHTTRGGKADRADG